MGMERSVEAVSRALLYVSQRFGYSELQECQKTAVVQFVTTKRDMFVSLPTGYGKSFCYSCLPWVFDYLHKETSPYHTVIAVSPLKALIEDQVKTLCAKGIAAVHVSNSFDGTDESIKQKIVSGQYSIVFTSPELLLGDKSWVDIYRIAAQDRLKGLVIDEAHCIKKW